MPVTSSSIDPYPSSEGDSYFECVDCGYRESNSASVSTCPECGGAVRNTGVAQE